MLFLAFILFMTYGVHQAVPVSISINNEGAGGSSLHRGTTPDISPKLTCGTNNFSAKFQISELKDHKLNINNIHFIDKQCIGRPDDNITVSITSPLGARLCGTSLSTNVTHATYRNTIYLPPDPAELIYREEMAVNIFCTYPLDMNSSLQTPLKPIISSTNIDVEGSGQFNVIMALYKDPAYTDLYTDTTISLPTQSTLYVGVFIAADQTTDFYVVMKNCFGTPTNNYLDPLKYYIIKDSCPNKEDGTIKVVANGISSQGQFSVQMFKFIGDRSFVYLHCQVTLCKKTDVCLPSCTKTNSRSGTSGNDGVLTIGPIFHSETDSGHRVGRGPVWSLLSHSGVLLLICLLL